MVIDILSCAWAKRIMMHIIQSQVYDLDKKVGHGDLLFVSDTFPSYGHNFHLILWP